MSIVIAHEMPRASSSQVIMARGLHSDKSITQRGIVLAISEKRLLSFVDGV